MKQSVFISVILIIAFVISLAIYWYVFGSPANFFDGATRMKPNNILGMIYSGGPLVALLVTLSIMDVAIIFERMFSLRKAAGKRSISVFFKGIVESLEADRIDDAIESCDKQRGSVANILRVGIARYKELLAEKKNLESEKKLVEIQRAVEEATMLETPQLEKNLIALSTIASIATMTGLLGTTLGMIRSFAALAQSGAPDAIALATGISEALINTAGGLIVAIIGIVAYNFFVNKVDNFNYQVDESVYSVLQIIKNK